MKPTDKVNLAFRRILDTTLQHDEIMKYNEIYWAERCNLILSSKYKFSFLLNQTTTTEMLTSVSVEVKDFLSPIFFRPNKPAWLYLAWIRQILHNRWCFQELVGDVGMSTPLPRKTGPAKTSVPQRRGGKLGLFLVLIILLPRHSRGDGITETICYCRGELCNYAGNLSLSRLALLTWISLTFLALL